MSPTATAAILACANPAFVLSTGQGGSFDLPAIEHGQLPVTSLNAEARDKVAGMPTGMGYEAYQPSVVTGDEIEVMFLGLAGHEQAAWLTRQKRYPEGNLPSVASTVDTLVRKYGPPTSDTGVRVSSRELEWMHEPSGTPMNPKNPHYLSCGGIGGYGSNFQVTSGCGLTIVANLIVAADGGVGQLDVTVMDQAAATAAIQREKADIAIINTPPGLAGKM